MDSDHNPKVGTQPLFSGVLFFAFKFGEICRCTLLRGHATQRKKIITEELDVLMFPEVGELTMAEA